jgi:hypothetical protein
MSGRSRSYEDMTARTRMHGDPQQAHPVSPATAKAFAKADHDFFDEHLIGWETE